MYNEKVIKIFQNPPNVGRILKPDGVGEVGNASCGDIMKIYLKINSDEIIVDAKFQTFGCAAAIASSSVMCDKIIGKSVEDALKVSNLEVIKELGELPAQKIHCSILAHEAVAAAVDNFRKTKKK